MARVFRKRLNVNDYPEEFREWLTDLFFNLDETLNSMQVAFNKRVNFRDNIDSYIIDVEDLMLSQIANESVTVTPTISGRPTDIMATVTLANTNRITVPVEWRVNDDNSITIINLDTTRISNTDMFTLRLTIIGN